MSAACHTASGSATKKTLQARSDIHEARALWTTRRKRFFAKALPRLIFIDETSTNTRLTKRAGWSPKGGRYRTHAPFGKWHTQTFITGVRCHGMVAPWIVNAPMNARRFETWIETQLAPELQPGDIVILDNVGFHKSERAAELVRKRGAWLLFLPPCSPRSQPDRDVRLKAQGIAAQEGSQNLLGTLPCARRHLRPLRPHSVQKLLQSCWI